MTHHLSAMEFFAGDGELSMTFGPLPYVGKRIEISLRRVENDISVVFGARLKTQGKRPSFNMYVDIFKYMVDMTVYDDEKGGA